VYLHIQNRKLYFLPSRWRQLVSQKVRKLLPDYTALNSRRQLSKHYLLRLTAYVTTICVLCINRLTQLDGLYKHTVYYTSEWIQSSYVITFNKSRYQVMYFTLPFSICNTCVSVSSRNRPTCWILSYFFKKYFKFLCNTNRITSLAKTAEVKNNSNTIKEMEIVAIIVATCSISLTMFR
jgi:hypothetical protein